MMNNSNQLHKVENNYPPLFFVSYRVGYKGEDEELKENGIRWVRRLNIDSKELMEELTFIES